MPLDPVVLDVLKSLEIAPTPPQVKAGDPIDLGLTPPGLNAFDLLFNPPTLFDIELNNITLDNIDIDLTDISLRPVDALGQEGFQLTLDASPNSAPGTDLELISKAVEFPLLDPPTGTTTTGRITGTVGQVQKFSGGITGNIGGHIKGRITGTINNLKGSVKAPQLSKSKPDPSVEEWYIEKENGERLVEGTDFVLLNKTMTDPAPSIMFLPVFAELSAGVDLNLHYRIFCMVKVTVGTEHEMHKLGPVNIVLAKIKLPTVLVMTEHAVRGVDYPGAVLVAVPSHSLLTLDQLTAKLGEVKGDLDRLKTISQVVGFGDTIKQINQIIVLIGPSTKILRFVKADEVRYLDLMMREQHWWGHTTWNDCISSLVMIGPPRRGARFCHMTGLNESEGAFQITLGRKGVGHIDTLSSSILACKPDDPDGCTFRLRSTPLDLTFNDKISSYQFLPLQ